MYNGETLKILNDILFSEKLSLKISDITQLFIFEKDKKILVNQNSVIIYELDEEFSLVKIKDL